MTIEPTDFDDERDHELEEDDAPTPGDYATWDKTPEHKQFVEDMEQALLAPYQYSGRFFWNGPAVTVDHLQEAMSKTTVPVQWDSMGMGYVVYPVATRRTEDPSDDNSAKRGQRDAARHEVQCDPGCTCHGTGTGVWARVRVTNSERSSLEYILEDWIGIEPLEDIEDGTNEYDLVAQVLADAKTMLARITKESN